MCFGKWKDYSKGQNNTTWPFKLHQSILWACSIVVKLYANARSASHRWNGQGCPRKCSPLSHHIFIYFQRLISDAWQLIMLLFALFCCGIYKRFDFNESYFTIHSFFAPKVADGIILYAHKVLKTFNRHLNCKCEFTMITGKTLCNHFWCGIQKFATLFSIIYSWYNQSNTLLILCVNICVCIL